MTDLPHWLQQTLYLAAVAAPYLLFFAFCLWALNWKRMWPTLRDGAWVPLMLLLILVALVWAQIRPTSVTLPGIMSIGNLWWQLFLVAVMAGVGLFAGWLQQRYGWAPAEVAVEPLAHADDHGHGHDHAHDHHGSPRPDDPMRKHTASHDRGFDRGGEA